MTKNKILSPIWTFKLKTLSKWPQTKILWLNFRRTGWVRRFYQNSPRIQTHSLIQTAEINLTETWFMESSQRNSCPQSKRNLMWLSSRFWRKTNPASTTLRMYYQIELCWIMKEENLTLIIWKSWCPHIPKQKLIWIIDSNFQRLYLIIHYRQENLPKKIPNSRNIFWGLR